MIIHTHNHFMAPFPGTSGRAGVRNLLLDFKVQGKIDMRQTHQQSSWAPLYPNFQQPTSFIAHFYSGCLFRHNPPNLSWLGTATIYAGLHTQWLGYHKTLYTYCNIAIMVVRVTP